MQILYAKIPPPPPPPPPLAGCLLTLLLLMQALDPKRHHEEITLTFGKLAAIDPYRKSYYNDLCEWDDGVHSIAAKQSLHVS